MRRASLWLVLALVLVHVSCTGTTKSGGGSTTPPAQIAVSVTPTAANVRAAAGQPFSAAVTGTTNQSVTWSVNGVVGGNATVGLITNEGLYTAPTVLPNPNTITISATSAADSSARGTSDVTLWNATPVLGNVSPATFTSGAYSLTLTGSKFVSGAQVLFGGAAITTTYVSATKLTATGSAPTAGIFAVSVSNPNPGSSNSSGINVTVTSQSGGNPPPPPPPSACSAISVGQGGSLNGFLPFPADNLWNKNIASAPVDPNSAAIINYIGTTRSGASGLRLGRVQRLEHRNTVHRGGFVAGAGGDQLHRLRRRERSGADAGAGERADRGLPESWERRSPRAGARQQHLLVVRALQFVSAD